MGQTIEVCRCVQHWHCLHNMWVTRDAYCAYYFILSQQPSITAARTYASSIYFRPIRALWWKQNPSKVLSLGSRTRLRLCIIIFWAVRRWAALWNVNIRRPFTYSGETMAIMSSLEWFDEGACGGCAQAQWEMTRRRGHSCWLRFADFNCENVNLITVGAAALSTHSMDARMQIFQCKFMFMVWRWLSVWLIYSTMLVYFYVHFGETFMVHSYVSFSVNHFE